MSQLKVTRSLAGAAFGLLVVIGLTADAAGQDLVCYDYDSYGRIERATYSDGSQLEYQIDNGDNRAGLVQATGQTPSCATPDGAGAGSSQAAPLTNTPPVAIDDVALVQAGNSATISVLVNDTDADADTLTVVAITQPTTGSAQIVSTGQAVLYSSIAGQTEPDSFTYTASDGNGGSSIGTVSISILYGG